MVDFAATGAPLTGDGFSDALDIIDAPPAALWAVLSVETSGSGYLVDRRPKILFERHIFHRLTGGQYDASNPDISAPTPGGYGPSGAHQYDRLQAALQLDEDAALKSASWGLGQIMGGNFQFAGYDDVDDMVQDFVGSEDAQLLGMAHFIDAGGLGAKLAAQDWAGFARAYNGPNYAANAYDAKLAQAYGRYANGSTPDLSVRAAQTYLNYLGSGLVVDGLVGPATRAAVQRYRLSRGLAPGDAVDGDLLQSLAAEPPGATL